MLFAGGPATEGPGQVVSNELKEPIRSHHDIDRDAAKHYKRSLKFYEGLAERAANNGHTVDLFAGCLDQVGLLEMKSLPGVTNGVIVLSDSFTTSIFKQSFLRIFNKDEQGHLTMGFNATFDVQVCRHDDPSESYLIYAHPRPPRSSRSLVSLATPFPRARSRVVSVKQRLVSAKPLRGKSTQLLPAPPPQSISKLLLRPASLSKPALAVSSNSLHTTNTPLVKSGFA